MNTPPLAIVITAFNEGPQLQQTIDSIQAECRSNAELIIVDDGSDDGSVPPTSPPVRVLRNDRRLGVACCRNLATESSTADVIAYFDAHQSVVGDSLSPCLDAARSTGSIICPDTCDFEDDVRLHGAYFTRSARQGLFSAEWKLLTPRKILSPVSSLKAPAYFIPRGQYPKVKWSSFLRGWGGSEACVSLKAFFAGVSILHLCGPLIRHKFKQKFHYEVGWAEVWRNHAMIARICFDDRTWYRYWFPEVFEPHLTDETKTELESDEMKAERAQFAPFKVRMDQEFWTRLIFRPLPDSIK